jgi:hypothetical protein
LQPGGLKDFDLVVAFEWAEVEAAVTIGGAARDKTFTLLELWGLIDINRSEAVTIPEHARAAVRMAQARRIRHAERLANFEMADGEQTPAEAGYLREICEGVTTALLGELFRSTEGANKH